MAKRNRLVSQNPQVITLGKAFENHLYKWQAHDLFRWFLDDVMADITQLPKDYPPPEEVMPIPCELGGLYSQAVAESPPFCDILGELYMYIAYSSTQSAMGQYFTPEHVAYLMAQINNVSEDQLAGNQLIRTLEPSAGSGIMLLLFCRSVMQAHGPKALNKLSLTAIDLDPLCSKMTAIQLIANAVIHQVDYGEVVGYCGNALSPSMDDFKVIIHASLPGIEAEQPSHEQRIHQIHEIAAQQVDQMEMFSDDEAA